MVPSGTWWFKDAHGGAKAAFPRIIPAMDKKEVTDVLREIALLLELAGEDTFKTRSYENGARAIEQYDGDFTALVEEGRLRELRGVGAALEKKIDELVRTGRLEYHEKLKTQFPPTIFELFSIRGLGPKKIRALYAELGIDALDALEQACRENRVAGLKGFGKTTQENILEGIAFARRHQGLFLVLAADRAAAGVLELLRPMPEVRRIEVAGSFRRCKEVIKDIDILVASDSPGPIMERFVSGPGVASVTGHGDTKSSVVLGCGIAADLRVVSEAQFPFALAYFTGSKEHNVVMRQRAKDRGLKLNEYGLFRGDGTAVPCADEAEIFAALGLPYIPPELREDNGEFGLTETPCLVERTDPLGIIHCHTTYSDGRATLEEMARAAQDRGYHYVAVCDHSQSAFYANGLKPESVARQHQEIDMLNTRLAGFRVLKGIESDIRKNGLLDYKDEVMRRFDLVVASVHDDLEMAKAEATARIVTAAEQPYCDILGHISGRLLLQREGYELDYDKVFDACAANNTAIEINTHPNRLDIDWRHIRRGRDKGVKFTLGPDAHGIEGLDSMRFGIGIARKGGLEAEDILNCLTAEELLAWRKPR